MQSIKHKLIAALLAMALLAGSLSVLAPSYPARALVPTATTIDIPAAILNGVVKAVEGGLYVVLRKFVQKYTKDLTKSAANYLFKGGRGKGPAYEIKPWEEYWEGVGDEAFGAALEGFVQGSVNSYEAQKKKEAVYKSLEDAKEETKKLSLEGGDLNYKLNACNKEADGITEAGPALDKLRECSVIAGQLEKKGEEQVKFYKDNAGKLKAQGIREDYSRDLERLQKELAALRTQEANLCNTQTTVYPDDPCKNKRTEITDKGREIDAVIKNADTAFAEASPETSDAIRGIEKEQLTKDANLVLGQTGALTEAGRTIIDIVCKPEADFALKIFLGLGDQISQTKRKPICPLDVFKKNWQTIFDAGFEPGGILSEQTVNGWQNLAALVNPETSDLGVAWKLSVSGHDVIGLARQLGLTDFDALSAVGGYKPITNLANTLVHTPAGLAKETVDRTVEANFEGATRFVPTGHIVADLVITAGAAFLETTLTLVKDGLSKRQFARKPKTSAGLAALSRYSSQKSLYFPDGDPNAGTEAFAEATLAVFDELQYNSVESWNVLNKITATGNEADCYDPASGDGALKGMDPESCAIDEGFNRAIREGMTVQQAIKNNLLDERGIFGFDALSRNPDAQPQVSNSTKHYPYNSLVILRKYRAIPVSWELAALYIKEMRKRDLWPCGDKKNCTLGMLKDQFNNPNSRFYQMVDPNWVLKIPPTRCALEGYGPQVVEELEIPSQDLPNDPTRNTTQIVRGKACVDYQTCLGEKANGECEKGYGYCLKEESVVHFTGETCKPIYDGCRAFTETTTKQNLTVLTGSLTDYQSGVCTADNAGCAWYSASQRLELVSASDARVKLDSGNRAKIFIEDTVRKEWLDTDKVFFASSAQKCEPKAEGCRQVDGPAGTPPYLRLPPTSLRCGANGVKEDGSEVQWYKREECKKYTQLCKQEYVGCEQYLPENDSIAVTGKSPDDSVDADQTKRYQYRCPAACANIYNYAEQKTLFEVPGDPATTLARTVLFSADTAQRCSVAEVGCEEFTNLDEVARGGEGKDYFTYLQRCVKEDNPENIPASEVFYHFVGSDTAGGQPEKHYVEGEGAPGDGYAPKCADASKPCDCSADDAKKSLYDPRIGTVPCREFINANGKPFYRYTDNLIYRTPDCTSYRRTIDNQAGIAHTYSPGLSRRCSAAAVDCREYRAPQAGNVNVISHNNFEGGTIGDWSSADTKYKVEQSNEGEIIGDHSLKLKKDDPNHTSNAGVLSKKIRDLRNDKSYIVSYSVKIPGGGSTSVFIDGGGNGEFAMPVSQSLSHGIWQRVQFILTKEVMANLDTDKINITGFVTSGSIDHFLIDDIVVKEVDGIEYVIRDSWVESREASCFNPKSATDPAPNFDSPAYSGCSLYTDRQGAQQAIRSFERICPNEMAGCVQATVKEGKIFEKAGDPDDKKKLVDSDPIYIIPDASKACQASDNKCTAYGVPKLLVKNDGTEQLKTAENKASDESRNEWKYREEWNIAYYKVTPEEALAAQSMFNADDTSPYGSGICRTLDLGCRAYTPSGGGETYFRDPGRRICQSPGTNEATWYYHTCEKTPSVVCRTNDDCPITDGIQEKCTDKKNQCIYFQNEAGGGRSANLAALPRCSCDKNDDILECDNAPVLPTDPKECGDITVESGTSYLYKIIKNSLFALQCPTDRNGCRRISDPNCRTDTKTLKDNYGRTPNDAGNSGISCQPEYYFTEDFDTRTKDCDGQVNPGAGCILVNDEKKEQAEYQLCQDSGCTTLGTPSASATYAIAQNDTTAATNPRTYCTCDRNTVLESDCNEKAETSPSDPDFCYNRYYNGSATPERELLRKYKKVFTEERYDSAALYTAADANSGTANVTAAAGGTPEDKLNANTLVKVRPDRQCKVWLECTSSAFSGKDKICTQRKPCDRGVPGVSCENIIEGPTTPPYLNGLLEDNTSAVTEALKKAPRKELLTLSGYARPDYKFVGDVQTKGGYGSNFGDWTTELLPPPAQRTAGRTIPADFVYADILPRTKDKAQQFVCSNDWSNQCATPLDSTQLAQYYAGNIFGLPDHSSADSSQCSKRFANGIDGWCIPHPGYLNACRLYPKQDTRGLAQENKIVDACQAKGTSSGGIYGYCLQPNPLFEEVYTSLSTPLKGFCNKSVGRPCDTANRCPGGEYCVYRYYENYCLNWLPVDRTGLESVFTASQAATYTAYQPQERLSYCIKTATTTPHAPGFPQKIGNHIVTRDFIYSVDDEVTSRDSSNVHKIEECSSTNQQDVKFEDNPWWLTQPETGYNDQCWINASKGQYGDKTPVQWQAEEENKSLFMVVIPRELTNWNQPKISPHKIPINNKEKYQQGDLKGHGFQRQDIGEITYTFDFSSERYKNDANKDGRDLIVLEKEIAGKKANDFEVTFVDIYRNAPVASLLNPDGSFIRSAFDGVNCAPDDSRDSYRDRLFGGKVRGYFSIRPRFSQSGNDGEIVDWEYAYCGYGKWAFTLFNSIYNEIAFINIKIKTEERSVPNYPIHTDDVNVSYKDDFCSEFVTVARDGAVADVSEPAKVNDPNTYVVDYISKKCDPSYTDYFNRPGEEGCGGNQSNPRSNLSSDYLTLPGGAHTQMCKVVNIFDHSTVAWLTSSYDHCTAADTVRGDWDAGDDAANRIDEQLGTTSCVDTGVGPQCLEQYQKLPPIVAGLEPLIANSASLDSIRTVTDFPFRKIYEYWQWDGGKYKKIHDIADATAGPLATFWDKTKDEGRVDPPRVYNDAGTINQFNVQPGTIGNDIQVSFWVNVKDSQLPLKGWNVILPHGKKFPSPKHFDGHGKKDNFSDSNTTPTGRQENVFGPFYSQYNPSTEPLANQPICIEVVDNWEACTRTCGTLNNAGRAIQTWTAPTSACQTYWN